MAGCTGDPKDHAAQETGGRPTASDSSTANRLEERIVDLTYPFDQLTIYWPTENGFQLTRGPAGNTDKGYYYAANRFSSAEHGGTHIDAPIHFFQDRDTVDTIPLERLIGDAVVVDVSQQCSADRDYQITVDDLYAWEEQHDRPLGNLIVLLKTGFGYYWPDRKQYPGTDETGPDAVNKLHFPGLDPQAARWLVEQRSIRAVGIDTPSIDFGQSTHFQSHVTLFEYNVPVFENVANLNQLPAKNFNVIALPMKIGGGSGAPLRIVAMVGAEKKQTKGKRVD